MKNSVLNKILLWMCALAVCVLIVVFYFRFTQPDIRFTPEERKWLTDHPVVRYSINTNFPPYEFSDERKQHAGYSADLLEIIKHKIPISFELIPLDSVKDRIIDGIVNNKIDLLTVVSSTIERSPYVFYTREYIRTQDVIIVRGHGASTLTIDSLQTMRVVLGSITVAKDLIARYPSINLFPTSSGEDALIDVSFGKADATIISLATASYHSEKHGLTNLRVAGQYGGRSLCMAVRIDWPIFVQILDKVLATIPQSQQEALKNKWLGLHQERSWQERIPWQWIVLGSGILLVFSVLALLWIKTLRRVVHSRTEDLQKSEERFHSLFDNVPIGLYRTVPDGRILMANKALIRMLGYRSFEELVQHNLEEKGFEPTYSRSQFRERIDRDGEIQGFESKWTWRDGSVVYVSESAKAVRDVKGHILYYEGTVEDITERKNVEADLENSHSLLEATIESTADGLLVVDNQGKIMRFNKKFRELWHIPEGILESREDETAITYVLKQLKDPDAFVSKVNALYSHPNEISFDILEFKDGRIFERYSCPQYVGEKIIGRVWSFRDVSERNHAEERLRYQADLMQNVSDAIIATDRENVIRVWNHAAEKIFGWKADEAIGKTVRELLHPEYAYQDRETVFEKIHGEGVWSGEILHHRKDGQSLSVFSTITILKDTAGNLDGYVSVSHDITERKQAEEKQQKLVAELQAALADVKTLGGLIPICSNCKKIRDDKGYWNILEAYLTEHSDARFTHGVCPDCMEKLYPGYTDKEKRS